MEDEADHEATPSTKLIRTGVLVNLPVTPTSESEYTRAARPGERRQKPRVSKLVLTRSSCRSSHRLDSTRVTMPMGTLM